MSDAADPARLGLGTAQFGLAYGVTRGPHLGAEGGICLEQVRSILTRCAQAGISVLDCAPAYGNAEAVLGDEAPRAAGFRVVTKLGPLAPDAGPRHATESLHASLNRLRRSRVEGLLVHRGRDLLGPEHPWLADWLREARERGLAAKVGVSVYDPAELEQVCLVLQPEIVQLPMNIFDQRFARASLPARLAAMGCEIHARSVFLQGTLACEPDALPASMQPQRDRFERVSAWLQRNRAERLGAMLGSVLRHPWVTVALFGVHSLAHLEACLATRLPKHADYDELTCTDGSLIDPRTWST